MMCHRDEGEAIAIAYYATVNVDKEASWWPWESSQFLPPIE